ncbi:unnamed protein product, partial [Hydatigera taeniaeformis]|uniref:PKD domain-containing protein n=1 Tax=Hydatigena taeniaeformis TaxID=6205 RepID=A0A0R3WW61_HYDTA
IEAAEPFHGTVELNGTNFRGTFRHSCLQNRGPCYVVIKDRLLDAGQHQVCAKAVARNGQSAISCLPVSIAEQQGKLQLYVDGSGAPLNGRTILRTRPISGDYDPRLSYSLYFGDGSPPVTGSNLDAMTLFAHNYTTEGKFTASMQFDNGQHLTCVVAVAHPIEEFRVLFPNGPVAVARKSINATVRLISSGPVSIEVGGEHQWFTLVPPAEGVYHANVTAYNLGFAITIPVTYQGQLDQFDIRIHLQQRNSSTTPRIVGAVEFPNYSGSRPVPLGFRLNAMCVPVKGAPPVAQVIHVHEKEKTFNFTLPPLGQFECTFTGQNDVWTTRPQNHAVNVTIPLILGGIGIFAREGAQIVTGCGPHYNAFEQGTSITLSVDIIQGDTEKVQWHLTKLGNLRVHFERVERDAKTIIFQPLDVSSASTESPVNASL